MECRVHSLRRVMEEGANRNREKPKRSGTCLSVLVNLSLFLAANNHFLETAAKAFDERQLGAADLERADDLYLDDVRRLYRVDFLHTETVGFFANGEAALCAGTADAEDKALKNLHAFAALAFGVEVFNLLVDANDHARLNFRHCDDWRGVFCFGHMKSESRKV